MPRVNMLMGVARLISSRSTCSRAQVGCVIAIDSRIISTGYNGAPTGLEHCWHKDDDDPCADSVHAEANAIAFAAKFGIAIDGATLYTTVSPCKTCAQLIINSGIKKVYYTVVHRDATGIELLQSAKINKIHLK